MSFCVCARTAIPDDDTTEVSLCEGEELQEVCVVFCGTARAYIQGESLVVAGAACIDDSFPGLIGISTGWLHILSKRPTCECHPKSEHEGSEKR